MKNRLNRIALALVLCATVAGGIASAKVKDRMVSFGQDFMVGSTAVKKGTYRVVFDDRTNELTIQDKQKTTIAKTSAHLEKRKNKSPGLDIGMAERGDNHVLTSVAFPGDGQTIIVNEAGSQSASTK